MPFVARTPEPPYYAVVFTSINADVDHTEHTTMYQRLVEVANSYDGSLGIEPARNTNGTGVAVIYWKDIWFNRGLCSRSRASRRQEKGARDLVFPLYDQDLQGRT